MTLDPGAQKVLDLIEESGRPPFEAFSVPEAREAYVSSRKALQPDPIDIAEVRDLSMPGPAGAIPLRLYRGRPLVAGEPQPVLVFYHGGGWVIGDLESHDTVCRELAHQSGCTIIAVDYRLAPEHVFPAAVDDCIAATEWVVANAAELGVDADRLAVGGDSAGGNLAAVVAIHARDNGGPAIKFQLMIYPATDMRMETASYAAATHPPVTRATMEWFIDLYMPDKSQRTDWRASPLLAKDLSNLPPSFTITAGYDPLSDEAEQYVEALEAAGSPAKLRRFPRSDPRLPQHGPRYRRDTGSIVGDCQGTEGRDRIGVCAMAMPGKGCFVAWYDLKPGREADHDHWHTHEHMIERVAIPGFLRGFRYRALNETPHLCVMYQTENLETLASPPYLERLNNPTPWSTRSLPLFVGMNRSLCAVAATFGHGIGNYLLTVQLSARSGEADRLKAWLSDEALPAYARRAGLSGAHLLIADVNVSATKTQEKELRGEPDAVADWVLLIEGYDRPVVEHALAELNGASGLVAHGAAEGAKMGLYSLDFALAEDEAKKIWRKPD